MQMSIDESRQNDFIFRIEHSLRFITRGEFCRVAHRHNAVLLDRHCPLLDESAAWVHGNDPFGPRDEEVCRVIRTHWIWLHRLT
jgi:hypothetical protein